MPHSDHLKNMKIMKHSIIIALVTLGMLVSSCEKYEEVGNENNPVVEDYTSTNTLDDLVLVSRGIEASLKIDLEFYVDVISAVGRETYDLNGADPRYTGELLGVQGGPLDPGGFLTTRSYTARYRAVKMCNLLIDGLETTSASLSAAEKNGFLGWAETMKAYSLLLNANTQYQNGIRVDVSNPDDLGPFLSYDASLAAIRALLDQGANHLSNGDLLYEPTSALTQGGTIEMLQLNRAIAARVSIYQNDAIGALDALQASFFDLNGDLNMGARHAYDQGDGLTNPLYNASNDEIMAVSTWVSDAELGDSRLGKVGNIGAISVDGLSSEYQV